VSATDFESPPTAAMTAEGPSPQPGRRLQGAVFPGRYTADYGENLVVFLVGFRFNGIRGLLPALQTFFKMPGMLSALERKPELGCLGGHVAFGWRTAYVMQYWRSYEDLERFAHAPAEAHVPAWRWYARLGAKGSGGGVWHETFRVAAGAYETIYVNMPQFGLAKATAHRSLAAASTSRQRISEKAAF
jgi:hypothetical protein